MFLVGSNKPKINTAISKLHMSLMNFGYSCGEIRWHQLSPESFLAWFSCKPEDNLHIYQDKVLIGKAKFSEKISENLIFHNSDSPRNLSSLLRCVEIQTIGNLITIKPHASTNCYYSGNYVSDMQLLVAKACQKLPHTEGVALLSLNGYFPGNETLFKDVLRIPYLFQYEIPSGNLVQFSKYTYRSNNDEQMLNRLAEIIPENVQNNVLISGGQDSRMISHCIQRSGQKPNFLHEESDEQEIVKTLAKQMDIPLKVIPHANRLTDEEYAIVSDAQIYAHGGTHQAFRPFVTENSVLHGGHCLESMNEFPWDAAWKRPKARFNYYRRLIRDGLLRGLYNRKITGIRNVSNSEEVAEYLEEKMKYSLEYYPRFSRSELARWFLFIHRGLRWAPIVTADISYCTYVVFLALDQLALEYAISSSAYTNFASDRARLILAKALPEVTVGYGRGQSHHPPNAIFRPFSKFYYEYLLGFIKMRKAGFGRIQKSTASPYTIQQHDLFENYFDGPAEYLFANNNVLSSTKRAAVVVNEALRFVN